MYERKWCVRGSRELREYIIKLEKQSAANGLRIVCGVSGHRDDWYYTLRDNADPLSWTHSNYMPDDMLLKLDDVIASFEPKTEVVEIWN